jgi:GDP-4-dehydro-6-deoxy-D-mannose reductase
MRVLVTGADGFVGVHLCNHLQEQGDEVLAYGGPAANQTGTKAIDIRNEGDVLRMVAEAQPESVVHLAGWASVGSSYAEPTQCFEVNALGTAYVLGAVRKECPKARVLLVSSGEVYGELPGGGACTETDPVAPKSPYAVSKLAAELVARQFFQSYATDVVITRSFNHVGPGQDERFVIPAFARQLQALAEGTGSGQIMVGNLDPIRDFSNVLDVVEAYRVLLVRGIAGETYNVCSGRARSIRDVLSELTQASGVPVELVVDPERVRPSDIARLVGDPRKINALGWRAHRPPLQGVLGHLRGAAS